MFQSRLTWWQPSSVYIQFVPVTCDIFLRPTGSIVDISRHICEPMRIERNLGDRYIWIPTQKFNIQCSAILTHWGRVTHICVSEIIITGSDNGLSPGRRQAIIWTNAGILLIGPLGINFSEILIKINTFSFNKMHLKMASAKWRLFRLGHNVLMRSVC